MILAMACIIKVTKFSAEVLKSCILYNYFGPIPKLKTKNSAVILIVTDEAVGLCANYAFFKLILRYTSILHWMALGTF